MRLRRQNTKLSNPSQAARASVGSIVCIKTFATRPEAELAKGMLAAGGIRAVVSVDDFGGLRPEVAFSRGARLLVDAGQAGRALEILSVEERPESAAEGRALKARLRGCMLPTLAGFLLLGVGAFVVDSVKWLGAIIILAGAALLVVGLVRGTRAV